MTKGVGATGTVVIPIDPADLVVPVIPIIHAGLVIRITHVVQAIRIIRVVPFLNTFVTQKMRVV
jgi:hypothetical protein